MVDKFVTHPLTSMFELMPLSKIEAEVRFPVITTTPAPLGIFNEGAFVKGAVHLPAMHEKSVLGRVFSGHEEETGTGTGAGADVGGLVVITGAGVGARGVGVGTSTGTIGGSSGGMMGSTYPAQAAVEQLSYKSGQSHAGEYETSHVEPD